jgi:hypothetical protein
MNSVRRKIRFVVHAGKVLRARGIMDAASRISSAVLHVPVFCIAMHTDGFVYKFTLTERVMFLPG